MPPVVTQQYYGMSGKIYGMHVCLYKEQATRKENRELCVTVPYKNNVGMYNSNDFGVFNLWYAYVVMKCFTSKQNKNKICIYNE